MTDPSQPQPYPGAPQPTPGLPAAAPGQPYPGQAQPAPGQPYPGQPQPAPGQAYPGQPAPAPSQAYPGQPAPAPGQPVPGQQYPGQQYPGQPYPGAAQGYPGAAQPGQPQPGQQFAQGYPGGAQGAASVPPKKSRKGLLIGLIAGGVALLLIIIGAVVVVSNIAAANSPEAKASTMFTALVEGDAEKAASMLGIEAGPLVSNEFYSSVPNAIESFKILTTETKGDASLVTAEVVQASGTSTVDLPLVRTKDGWQVDAVVPTLGAAVYGPTDGLTVAVNGTETKLAASDLGAVSLLPGDYTITVTDPSGLVEASPLEVSYRGLTGGDAFSVTPSSGIDLALSADGAALALAAATAHLNACIAQAALAPTGGCGFGVQATEGESYSDIVWTLVTGPTISVGGWDGTGWSVDTDAAGSADMDCRFSNAEGTGTCWLDGVSVDVWGTVTDLTADGGTFVSTYP